MTIDKECIELRKAAEDPKFQQHAAGCAHCRQWQQESADIVDMAAALPQFDVSEHVTQNILAAVDQEARLPILGHHGLLLPLGVVCLAFSLTLLPVDTLEGFAATAVAGGLLLFVNLFIRAGKSEEVAAS